jgi:hypothetical protein
VTTDESRSRLLRSARWAVVVVPLVEVLLVVTGVLDLRTGLVVGLAVEVSLAGLVLAEAVAFRRAYRRARGDGAGRAAAVSTGLAVALPAPVAWFLRTETGIARSLWWAVRGRRAVEPGDVELPYTDRISVLLWTTFGLGVLESAAVHLLVPWPTVRWVLLGSSVYGLLWILGLAFSLRQHPHVLRGDELLLRFGHFRTTRIPLTGLAGVRRDVRTEHRRNIELDGRTLALSVAGETTVELTFTPDAAVEVRSATAHLERIRFFTDYLRAAVRLLGERVRAGEPAPGGSAGPSS